MFSDLTRWATSADTGEFWFLTGIPMVAAVALFLAAFYFLRKARLMEDTPTSRIRSAAQGYVELEGIGRLMEGPEIFGALTSLPCLWWTYKIEQKVTTGSGKNRRTHWRTISSGTSTCLFHIDDDTGTCVVDPDGAKVITAEKDFWYGFTPRWSGPPKKGMFRMMGAGYRYTERRLQRNRPLYALGWFKTVGGAGSDFDTNEEVRQKLAEWKRDQAALTERFDMNKDGVVDMDEWELVRKAAEDEVRQHQLERALKPGVNVLCIPPRHHGRPYLLSAIPQDKLIKRFRWSAGGCLLGFFLTGALATFLVGARLTIGM